MVQETARQARSLSARGSLWLAAALLAGLSSACGGHVPTSAPIVDPADRGGQDWREATYGPETEGRAPSWSTLPNSWGKLSEIERWLAAAGSQRGFWVTEARLQLAEGQLAFSTELLKPGTDPTIVRYRQNSARDGFQTVLTDGSATADQRGRAQRGIARVGRIPATAPAAAPVTSVGGLIRRSAWNARRPNQNKMRRASDRWRWITVHHSVFTAQNGSVEASLDTVRRIQRAHVDVEGWADIGYHFLIDREGRVIEGRELIWQGAHAGGNNNVGNVGICLLGNFEVERPTRAALASLDRLVLELQRKLVIPRNNVRPHKRWTGTKCPGKHLMPWFTRS